MVKSTMRFAGLAGTVVLIGCFGYTGDIPFERRELPVYDTTYVPAAIDSLLVRSLGSDNSRLWLDSFFGLWESECRQISASVSVQLDDTLELIVTLCASLHTQYTDTSFKFLVLQDSLQYSVLDSFWFDRFDNGIDSRVSPDTLKLATVAFRPRITSPQSALFLMPRYNRSLNYYFNETDGNTNDFPTPLLNIERHILESKVDALRPYMYVDVPYYGRGMSFVHYPIVDAVVILRDLSLARVRYRDSDFSGGTDEFRHAATGWIRTNNLIRWII